MDNNKSRNKNQQQYHKTAMNRLIIRHARQIVQVCSNGEPMICQSNHLQNVSVMENNDDSNGGGFSLVVDENGQILNVGTDDVIGKEYEGMKFEQEIDATGKCVIPGTWIELFFSVYLPS